MFTYQHVELIRVIDGDTVAMVIDMGNNIHWSGNFRLMGIDSPERGKSGYAEANAYLNKMLSSGISRIQTYKPDKYGRWLADVYVSSTGTVGEVLVNRMMVAGGYAVPYTGGSKTMG